MIVLEDGNILYFPSCLTMKKTMDWLTLIAEA